MERVLNRQDLELNLGKALTSWQTDSVSIESIKKMEDALKNIPEDLFLTLHVNREVVKEKFRENFFAIGVPEAYGRREGKFLVFDGKEGISFRISSRGHLFVERHGQPIGFLQSEAVSDIKISSN